MYPRSTVYAPPFLITSEKYKKMGQPIKLKKNSTKIKIKANVTNLVQLEDVKATLQITR